jgi:hypothetical protein
MLELELELFGLDVPARMLEAELGCRLLGRRPTVPERTADATDGAPTPRMRRRPAATYQPRDRLGGR